MNRKIVTVLTVIVAVLALAALLAVRDEPNPGESAALFPDIDLAQINQLEIKSRDSAVTLSLVDDQWQVLEKEGYPADVKQLSELVNQLGKATLVEKKTSRTENFASLDVADIDQTDSEAVQVTFAGDTASYAVLVGKTSSGRSGKFVRKPGDNQVWLTDESPTIDKTGSDWVEPIIIAVEEHTVSSVTLSQGDDELTFQRGEDGEFTLLDMPAERSLKYPSIVNEPARALASVRLEDVSPHDPDRWQEPSVALFTLDNQTRITIQARLEGQENAAGENDEGTGDDAETIEEEERHWIHISIVPGEDDATAYGDLSLWDYQVASYVFDDFVKTMDDLLAEETPEEPATNEPDPSP